MKAYLRGQIISFSTHLNKCRHSKIQDLSNNTKSLDQQIALSPSPDLLNKRVALQTEFDLLTTTATLCSRATYCEHGDKAGRLLAHQLRRQAAPNFILQIKDSTGVLHTDPTAINSTFSSFYFSLYSSEAPTDPTEMHSFLDELNFPTVNPEAARNLYSPLTEIVTAIINMHSNKAPGPDGFPVDFFKKFNDQLALLLHSVYVESLQSGSLPPTLCQASINVLLKKR